MMRPVSIGNRVGAGQYVNQVTYRTNSADHLLDDEMQTPVHAGGHDYPAVRDRSAGYSQAAQARAKSPRQVRQFRRTGSLYQAAGW
jgi:hypothetical protein